MTTAAVANLHSTGSHGGGFSPGAPVGGGSARFGTFAPNTTPFNAHGSGGDPSGSGLTDNTVQVLRVGDTYLCPIHGPNPVVRGSAVWADNGRPIARLGDLTACGAAVTAPVSPEWSSE